MGGLQGNYVKANVQELISTRLAIYAKILSYKNFSIKFDEVKVWLQALDRNGEKLRLYGVDLSNLEYNSEKLVCQGFVGLFWLEYSYKKLLDPIGGEVYIGVNAVKEKITRHPNGGHSDYSDKNIVPARMPRGRVTLVNGDILISLGTFAKDKNISLIKKLVKNKFCLGELERACKREGIALKYDFEFHQHWNPKDNY
jgi:hypothetical protein